MMKSVESSGINDQVTSGYLHPKKHEGKKLKILIKLDDVKCGVCSNIWNDVITISPCLHNFCNDCYSRWVERSTCSKGEWQNTCPQCKAVVLSVGRNDLLQKFEKIIRSQSCPNKEVALQDVSSESNLDKELEEIHIA